MTDDPAPGGSIAAIPTAAGPAIEISPTDPLFAYLQAASGVVDAARLELTSPALTDLRAAGVRMIVPLVSQGELIGALYLGPRLSDQDYSTDDRKLLATLAATRSEHMGARSIRTARKDLVSGRSEPDLP